MRLDHWQAMLLASDPAMLDAYNKLHVKHAERLGFAREVGADIELLDDLTVAEFRALWDLNARISLYREVETALKAALKQFGAVISLSIDALREEDYDHRLRAEGRPWFDSLRATVVLSPDDDRALAGIQDLQIGCTEPRSQTPLTAYIFGLSMCAPDKERITAQLELRFIERDRP